MNAIDEYLEQHLPPSPILTPSSLTCSTCHKQFTSLKRLQNHQKIPCGLTNICVNCGIVFKYRQNLQRHLHQSICSSRPLLKQETGTDTSFIEVLYYNLAYPIDLSKYEHILRCIYIFVNRENLREVLWKAFEILTEEVIGFFFSRFLHWINHKRELYNKTLEILHLFIEHLISLQSKQQKIHKKSIPLVISILQDIVTHTPPLEAPPIEESHEIVEINEQQQEEEPLPPSSHSTMVSYSYLSFE